MKSPFVTRSQWIAILILIVAVAEMVSVPIADAQTFIPAEGTGTTLAELKMRLKHAQSETELAPKHKQEVIDLYGSAIQRFELANEAVATANKFNARLDSVADELRQTRQKLTSIANHPAPSVPAGEDVDLLQRTLDERRKLIADPDHGLQAKVEAAKKEVAARKARVEEVVKDLAEVEERMASIEEEFGAPIPDTEPREVTIARQTYLQVRKMRATQERMALLVEQDWCESEDVTNLLRAQHDLAAKELALAETEVELLQAEVDQRRGSEADRRIRAAEAVVANSSAAAKSVAQINRSLAVETRDVATTLHETNQSIDSAQEKYTALKAEFDHSTQMVEAVGLTESIGLLLRQQRAKLSDTRSLHSRVVLRGEMVRHTKMRAFEIDAEIASLSDLDTAAVNAARELMSDESASSTVEGSLPSPVPPAVRALANEIKPLLQQRRELLERLNVDYNTQFQKLVLLDNDERKLLDATQKYAEYIDERVLWIRTGGVFGGTQVSRAAAGSSWLVDQTNWQKVVDALKVNFHREPLPYGFGLSALLCWGVLWWSMRSRLFRLGAVAADESCHELFPTLQAVPLTVILSAITPLILGFVGWRLDHCASTSKFVHAVGLGLLRMAVFAAPLELLHRMVAHGGLAEKHFEWSPKSLSRMRLHLNWFLPVGTILIGLIGLLEAFADEQRLESLGRLGFIIFAGLLTLFCVRIFPHMTSAVQLAERTPVGRRETVETDESSSDEDIWIKRLIRLGTFLVVVTPLVLLVLSWSGYFYTALQLTWRLQATAWLAMGMALVRGVIRRWITLERRRMAVFQAEELKAIAEAGQEPGGDGRSPFLLPRWTWPDFRLNVTQIVSQVRSLLDTGLLTVAAIGLWFVWADVTPALNILDRVVLWRTTVETTETAKGADGTPIVQVVKRPLDINAGHLGMALFILSIAAIAGRNIPGLVEVILLEHLSLDAGARFATTCLVRYTIFIAGVCLAFNQIGIGWNSVQWLVAAASVGLGFGLQEIFANFVSGIILLFERPMRVGDVITVGNTTGTVSKIRFRATTIVDGDRKELIVPNKTFITDNLLNWTLSDSINRIVIKVTVSHGCQPDRVRELLLKIASQHPCLLKEPAPAAILETVGKDTLVFELNAFLPNLQDRPKVTHDLNAKIHDDFRAAGIQFPLIDEIAITPRQLQEHHRDAPITNLHASLEAALQRAGVKI